MEARQPKKGFWRVGELAGTAGVSADTLRHYEKKGLLHPRRSLNGYREYPAEALERLKMIRHALTVGFTLDELSAIFKVFDQGGAPCKQVRNIAAGKLAEIESHVHDLIALRDELRESLLEWDARLTKTTAGQRAGLLEALAARNSLQHSSTSRLLRRPTRRKGRKSE